MTKQVKVDGKKTKITTIIQIKEAPNLGKQYSTFQFHQLVADPALIDSRCPAGSARQVLV